MLQITIPAIEFWDEKKEEFINTREQTLRLEHSLVSISKWETKWCRPYMDKKEKTLEETLDYIRCMTITQKVDPDTYLRLTDKNLKEIYQYIEAPMTATRLPKEKKGSLNGEQITAELIYYWMITLKVPIEFQKWHLNRLITLIRVLELKNRSPKKKSQREIMNYNAALNEERKRQYHTKG